MLVHSYNYKEELKKFGRRIRPYIRVYNHYNIATENNDIIITEDEFNLQTEQVNQDDVTIINASDIFSIDIINQGDLLKSLMKQCNVNLKQELKIGDEFEVVLEVLIDEQHNYWDLVTYDTYIIYSKEYNFDTKSWNYVCYDKMLFAMKKYETLNIQYPTSISYYLTKLAEKIGLGFANEYQEFTNYNQLLYDDVYRNSNVTYRDILDDISEVVGGNICEKAGSLEIRYPQHTYQYEHQLIDFSSLVSSDEAKVTSNFQNDILTLNNTGSNDYCYQDITMRFLQNQGKILRFDFDSITQNVNFTGDIVQLHIYYNNNTINTITLLTRDKQINTYTIPSSVENINKVYFVVYANNSNIEVTGDLIINKPYLHFGANKEEYIPLTDDTLDETCIKDIRGYFGDKFGPVNKVVIENENKNINYYAELPASIEENGETKITIQNNLLITENNFIDIAKNILDRLQTLVYYSNDFSTIGFGYYEFLDIFNVVYESKTYQCLLLNSEFNITTGLEENIYTDITNNSLDSYISSSDRQDYTAQKISAKGNAYANGERLIQENEFKETINDLKERIEILERKIDN